MEMIRNNRIEILKKNNFCAINNHIALTNHIALSRVQYDYLLHRNCFLLINMLENGMSRANQYARKFHKIQFFFNKFENFIFFLNSKFS
jgi:hypothetical protein